MVSGLAPQTYETLGSRAQRLFALAAEESDELVTGTRNEAQAQVDAAEEAARQKRDSAREQADSLRADADVIAGDNAPRSKD